MLSTLLQSIIENDNPITHYYQELDDIDNYLTKLNQLEPGLIAPHMSSIVQASQVIHNTKLCLNKIAVKEQLNQYLQEMESVNMAYAKSATKLQLHSLESILCKWLSRYSIQLPFSRVLIIGSHGPREGLIEMQYFEHLFEKQGILKAQNHKIFYVEMLPEQMTDLDLIKLIPDFLSKHSLNQKIGKNLLGDEQAMNRDVLGKYAPEVLKTFKETICPFQYKK